MVSWAGAGRSGRSVPPALGILAGWLTIITLLAGFWTVAVYLIWQVAR